MKERSRVSYPKEMRAKAKALECGLVTVQIEKPSGERVQVQAPVGALQYRFLEWAAALVLCPDVNDLPDVQTLVRKLMEIHD